MKLILLKNNSFFKLQLRLTADKSDVFKAADVLSYSIGIDAAQEEFIKLANLNQRLIEEINFLPSLNFSEINNLVTSIYNNESSSSTNFLSDFLNKNYNSLCLINIFKEFLMDESLRSQISSTRDLDFIKTTLKEITSKDNINNEILDLLNVERLQAGYASIKNIEEVNNFLGLIKDLL